MEALEDSQLSPSGNGKKRQVAHQRNLHISCMDVLRLYFKSNDAKCTCRTGECSAFQQIQANCCITHVWYLIIFSLRPRNGFVWDLCETWRIDFVLRLVFSHIRTSFTQKWQRRAQARTAEPTVPHTVGILLWSCTAVNLTELSCWLQVHRF